MKIIIEGRNCENYYAKVHEAYRTGLRSLFDARCYGIGYPKYDESIKSFVDIKDILFGKENIDLILLSDCWDPRKLDDNFIYSDLEKLNCKKAIMLCDFWSEADCQLDEYIDFIERNQIDYILSYFRAPFHLWENTTIYEKLIWFPPSFDPKIFNKWNIKKRWEVGNLNASIFSKDKFYPERYEMHQILSGMEDISYLTAAHPGTGFLPYNTPLIGKSFSMAISSCKIFVTSGNLQYKNFSPKYVEIMASGTCLLAYEPMDADIVGLVDGKNYVKITVNNLEEKVRYYLSHDEEREQIALNGYSFVLKYYNCYNRAAQLFDQLCCI